jgi:hypothetical protein
MPWRPYSAAADDDTMDDVDEGYTDVDEGFADEGYAEDGWESASDAPLTSRSMRYGGDKASRTRGVHLDDEKSQGSSCCRSFCRCFRTLVCCSVLGAGGYVGFGEYKSLKANGAAAECVDITGNEGGCALAASVCAPSHPHCRPLVDREITRLRGHLHDLAPSVFSPVPDKVVKKPLNETATLMDSAVRGMLGDYVFVIDPRASEPGDACEEDDAEMPDEDTMRGPQSTMKGWRVVQKRFADAPDFPLKLRVVRGYTAEDFSRLDLQKQLGAGNLSHPMSPRCTDQTKDAMWALSHIKAWHYAQSCCLSSQWTMFMENDVYPHPQLTNALRNLPKWLKDFPAARMVYLGWCFSYTHGDG